MKRLINVAVILFFIQVNVYANEDDLNYIRANYNKAVSDKILCAQIIQDLKLKKDEPVYMGYLGGFQAIWANHVFSPVTKLKVFNQGKEHIENAIKQDPENIELRFIRLSVQKNAPSFLGYSSMIDQDIDFLKTHRKEIRSNVVIKNVETLLND